MAIFDFATDPGQPSQQPEAMPIESVRPNDPRNMPMGRIFAAVMRGNAMVQGQSQAKEIAGDQIDGNQGTKFSFTGKRTAGGVPIVKFEGPADLLNQTQQSDAEKAYDTPHANVERKLGQLGLSQSIGNSALRSSGYVPMTDEQHPVTPADLKGFRDTYRAQRASGEEVPLAFFSAVAKKLHMADPQAMADTLNRERAMTDAAATGEIIKPALAISQTGNAAERLDFERNRAHIADLKEQRAEVGNVTSKIDYGKVSFANWRKETENALGRPLTNAEYEQVVDKGSRDVNTSLDAFLGKGDAVQRATLGSYATLDDAKAAYGGEIPPARERQFAQTYAASKREYDNANAKEKAQIDLQRAHVAIANRQLKVQEDANRLADIMRLGGTPQQILANLDPGTRALVDSIRSGATDITKVTTNRGGQREQMAAIVSAIDPSWSTATAPARAATYKDFTSGQTFQKSIIPFNTAIHHLDIAKQAVKELGNAPVQVWNTLRQKGLEGLAGDARYAKYAPAATLLSGEIGKLAKGGVPDKQELEDINKLFSTANSPQQLNGAIDQYMRLIGGRAIPLAETYAASAQTAPPPGLILTNSSERILRKWGFDDVAEDIAKGSTPAAANAAAAATQQKKATHRFNPATNRIEALP